MTPGQRHICCGRHAFGLGTGPVADLRHRSLLILNRVSVQPFIPSKAVNESRTNALETSESDPNTRKKTLLTAITVTPSPHKMMPVHTCNGARVAPAF